MAELLFNFKKIIWSYKRLYSMKSADSGIAPRKRWCLSRCQFCPALSPTLVDQWNHAIIIIIKLRCVNGRAVIIEMFPPLFFPSNSRQSLGDGLSSPSSRTYVSGITKNKMFVDAGSQTIWLTERESIALDACLYGVLGKRRLPLYVNLTNPITWW
jgi:hypothetical protein